MAGNAADPLKFKVRYTNVYLIRGSDGYLMVDTGPRTEISYIMKQLERHGVRPEDVKFVLLTHHHHDHAGNLAAVMANLPRARLVVHRKEVDYISRGKMKLPHGRNLCLKIVISLGRLLRFDYEPYVPTDDDIVLDTPEFDLSDYGFDWRVIHTPGHTSGSISIVSGEDAIVGDLVMDRKDWCGSSPLPAFLESMDETMASWRKLLGLGVKRFWPSHGSVLPHTKLKKHIDT